MGGMWKRMNGVSYMAYRAYGEKDEGCYIVMTMEVSEIE